MSKDHRTINFLRIPHFIASVERVQNKELRQKPIIIAPLKSGTAKVWGVSREALSSGIRKGMDLEVAKRLDRSVHIIHPNPDLYKALYKKIIFDLSRLTPLFESEALGRAYLDFTGFEKLYGEPLDFARKIKRRIQEDFQLSSRLGVAHNKILSRAATNSYFVKEDTFAIDLGSSENFLDPFPYDTIPPITTFKQRQRTHPHFDLFDELNLEDVQSLKQLPITTLNILFDGRGYEIYNMARGIDSRPVRLAQLRESVSFDKHLGETNNHKDIMDALQELADQAFSVLRRRSKSCRSFKLGIRYSDFKFLERKVTLKYSVSYSHEIHQDLQKSLSFLYSRRTSLRYLLFELLDLSSTATQMTLFTDQKKELFDIIDKINEKFPKKIHRGRT